jgi:hypothetical protein
MPQTIPPQPHYFVLSSHMTARYTEICLLGPIDMA